MTNRPLVSTVALSAFLVASGVAPRPAPHGAASTAGAPVVFPGIASAAGSCSLTPLVCANDTSPGCEIICGGEQQAVCTEGSCSTSGNIVNANRCVCK